MNEAISYFKKLTDDEAEYLFDLMVRCVIDCSHTMSSTSPGATKLGTETRLARKNYPHPIGHESEVSDD